MNPFKKKLKPTTPYMPAVRAAIDAKDFVKAVALVIKLHRHIANELERADPTAAAYAKALEPMTLPPIEYQTVKGGGK